MPVVMISGLRVGRVTSEPSSRKLDSFEIRLIVFYVQYGGFSHGYWNLQWNPQQKKNGYFPLLVGYDLLLRSKFNTWEMPDFLFKLHFVSKLRTFIFFFSVFFLAWKKCSICSSRKNVRPEFPIIWTFQNNIITTMSCDLIIMIVYEKHDMSLVRLWFLNFDFGMCLGLFH